MNYLNDTLNIIEVLLENKQFIIDRVSLPGSVGKTSILLESPLVEGGEVEFVPYLRGCANMQLTEMRRVLPLNNPDAIDEMTTGGRGFGLDRDRCDIVAYLCFKFIKTYNTKACRLYYPIQEPEGMPFWATEMRWQYVEFVKAELTYYREHNKVMGFK